MRHSSPTAAAFVLALVASAAFAQTWQPAAPTASPPGRWATAMATDIVSGETLLFGGYDGSYRNDTWAYDGTTWTPLAGPAPSLRGSHALVHDSLRDTFVLFGGIQGVSVGSYLYDTWEHSNGSWTQRVVAVHPSARFGHAMAYDPQRGRVVLFGGRTNAGTIFLNDTWEWNGTAWTGLLPATSPARRMGAAMAFDPVAGRVLMFGGQPIGGLPLGDTWSWDGSNWTLLAPTNAPSPRTQAVLALDPARQRLVLHGGYFGADLVDTHEWDGATWTPVPLGTPPDAFGLPGFASDPSGRHVVLFGGQTAAGTASTTTWRFGQLATAQPYGLGCGSPALAAAAAPGSLPVLGQGFVTTMANVPAGAWPFVNLGLSRTAWNGVPLPLDMTPLGMPGCWLHHDSIVIGQACTLVGSDAHHTLPLPSTPSLAGRSLFVQGAVLAIGSNPLGLLSSNGLELVLGYP